MPIALYITFAGIYFGMLALMYCVLESGHDRDEDAPTYGGLPR